MPLWVWFHLCHRENTSSSTIPARCVAVACSNTHCDRVSLFRFPRDPNIRKKWVKQVQHTRAKWKPTGNSVLCSEHLEENCFEPIIVAQFRFRIKLTRKLKPDTVSSISSRKRQASTNSSVHNVALAS